MALYYSSSITSSLHLPTPVSVFVHVLLFRAWLGTKHYTTLHYTTLHYTTLQYTTIHYTKLQQTSDTRIPSCTQSTNLLPEGWLGSRGQVGSRMRKISLKQKHPDNIIQLYINYKQHYKVVVRLGSSGHIGWDKEATGAKTSRQARHSGFLPNRSVQAHPKPFLKNHKYHMI